jgi:peptide/nickel transport system substrate-binding protein
VKMRLFTTLGIVLIVVMLISSCSSSTTSTTSVQTTTPATQQPQSGGSITMLWQDDKNNPGYPQEYAGTITSPAQIFFEALVRITADGKFAPWLANSWDLAPDNKSMTLKLRQDVKFHDGTPFNAEAVKWNIGKYQEKKNLPWIKSVDIIDDYTVRVNVDKWMNQNLISFNNATYFISPTAFDKNGIDWVRLHPIGTGPFIFDSFVPGVSIKGVKNPNYWRPGEPYLDSFEIKYVADIIAREAALQSGQGNVMMLEFGKQTYDMQQLGFNVVVRPEVNFCLFPSSANAGSPWANQKVREAAEYAIDRETIAKQLGYGQWQAPYQVVARNNAAYDPNFVGRKYDPEKAKQLLAEAGYANGFDTTLYPSPSGINKDVDAAVQSDLNKVGIRTSVEFMDSSKFFNFMMNSATWEGLLIQGVPQNANMNYTLYNFFSGQLSYYFVSTALSPELKAATLESVNSSTMNVDLMRKVIKQVFDDCTLIPLYEGGRGYAMDSKLDLRDHGFTTRDSNFYYNPESMWINK